MVFTVKNTQSMLVKVYDAQDTEIKGVLKYNTRTREVTVYLTGQHPVIGRKLIMRSLKSSPKGGKAWESIKVKVKIQGSYILVNGKRH